MEGGLRFSHMGLFSQDFFLNLGGAAFFAKSECFKIEPAVKDISFITNYFHNMLLVTKIYSKFMVGEDLT